MHRCVCLRAGPVIAVVMMLAACFQLVAAPSALCKTIELNKTDISLKHEVDRAYRKGQDFLKSNQNPDGSWSNPDFPALTGLVVFAFLKSPEFDPAHKKSDFIRKGLDFIVSNAKKNGGIYKEALPNYNTAICIMALLASGDDKYHPYLLKGRRYLASLQLDKGKKGITDEAYDGGVGYGTKGHSDLSNTYMALESIRLTAFLESDKHLKAYQDLEGLQNTQLDWKAALQFIQRCQNLPKYNDQAWASDDPKNKGGFVYYPGSSKAGEETLANGKTALRSYGSMTYAGLLSMIYTDLNKDDPRLTAAYEWIEKNFTLEENPGMGQQGLYYYYHIMAKTLSVMGKQYIKTPGGDMLDWRNALTVKLVSKQRSDGSWLNETARWWENDPVLVTAYALIAMNLTAPGL